MTDAQDSDLPVSLRDHPVLSRLRSSLRELAPDPGLLASTDGEPVERALALSGLLPSPPDVTG